MLGKAIGGTAAAMLQGTILLILAPFLGISLTPLIVVKYLFLVMLLALSLSGVGIFVATRMRSQQGFQMVMQLLIFPLIFLSGVFFPVDNVSPWLQFITKLNPLTYGVDAVRQIFLDGNRIITSVDTINQTSLGITVLGHKMGILEDTLIIAVLGLSLLAAAVWSFTQQEQ